jgi:hypothetical protein
MLLPLVFFYACSVLHQPAEIFKAGYSFNCYTTLLYICFTSTNQHGYYSQNFTVII